MKPPDFYPNWYEKLATNSNEKELISFHLKEQIKEFNNPTCLEIGIGTEPVFYEALKDIMSDYEAVEKEVTQKVRASNITVIEGDWELLHISKKYDVIICSHVLYYFKNKYEAIRKMIDSLNLNGKIFFVVNGNEKDYAKLKSYFSGLVGVEYISTYSMLKDILKGQSLSQSEVSFTSTITFGTHQELYESLRLSFDLNIKEYEEFQVDIQKFMSENFLNNQFEIEQKMLIVSSEKDWSRLLNHENHELKFGDIIIDVQDGVFTPNPDLTYSSSIIIDNFPEVEGKTIADIGSGSGVLSIYASKMGAEKILATDISQKAVDNTRDNIDRNNSKNIQVIQTNLLNGIDKEFDYIFANLPIKSEIWDDVDIKLLIEKLLIDLKTKTNKDSKVYLPWASFAEQERDNIEQLFKVYNWSFECIKKEHLRTTWYLYILSKN